MPYFQPKQYLAITKFVFLIFSLWGFSLLTNIAYAQHITPMVTQPSNPPGAPGAVAGPSPVGQGGTYNYSVTAASGATSYSWSLSNSQAGTITGTTTTVSIHWSPTFAGYVTINCSAVNSKGSTAGPGLYVQVNAPVTPLVSGVISPAIQNLNSLVIPATLLSSAATGGNQVYSYQWQSSPNNSTWTSISGAIGSNFAPSNTGTNQYYRLITTSNGVSVTSNTAFISCSVTPNYSSSNNLVSVNELTGTANVIIPLYTIKAAHIDFPINLVYSATGIKGTDMEGNAGMGWNVSLGGAVTRQLRGLPDDITQDSKGNQALGWLYSTNRVNINNLSFVNDGNTATCADETTDISTLNNNFPNNNSDTEPDIFQVNAPGLSCQLIFDENNNIQISPYQDLKVSYTTSTQTANQRQITSFTITNDQGITYTFSAVSTTTQQATTTLSNVNYFQSNYNLYKNLITYNSSWGLTSVSDIHGNSINLTYKAAPTVSFTNPVQLSIGGAALTTLYTMQGSSQPQNVTSIYCTNNVSGQGQTFQIAYTNTPESNKFCVTNITGMGHNFIFGYNNVNSTGGNFTRYFLNSIVDEVCSAQSVNGATVSLSSYAPLNLTFNYLNTGSLDYAASTLAGPLNNNVDYWGYTNSASSNTTLLPTIDINPATSGYERYRNRQIEASPSAIYTYSITGANRETDQNCTTGTLSRINYSTGGYTQLSYEPNSYYDYTVGATVQGGGIRVTQVLDHDGISSDNDFIKTYTYNDPATGNSFGKALSLPIFSFTTPYSGANTGAALWTSSTMVSPTDLSGEDHSILYSVVTETINSTGSTVYKYALPATNWDSSAPSSPYWHTNPLPVWNPTLVDVGRSVGTGGTCQSIGVLRNDVNTYPFPPNVNYDFERGLLTNVLQYNNSGTQVSESDYYYQTPETPIDITALRYDVNSYATNYAKYIIHTSANPVMTSVVNKIFDLTNVSPGSQPTIAQVTTTNNTYNTLQHKLSQQSVNNPDNSINTTNIKYVKDYSINTPCDSYLSSLLALKNLNVNVPVEIYHQFTPVNSTQAVTVGADLTLFGIFPNQGVDALVGNTVTQSSGPAPLQHLSFTSTNNLTPAFAPSSIVSTNNTNTFQYDNRYVVTENDLAYDYTGFLVSKDDGFQHVKTYIYDNLHAFRLRAILNNVSYDQIGMEYPVLLTNSLNITSLSTNSPNAYNFLEVPNGTPEGITLSTVYRNGEQSFTLAASNTLAKTVNRNPAAKNYVFSMWVNSANSGLITVTITDGTNTVSKPLPFDATVGNAKYPTGFEYCQVSLPLTTLNPTSPLTISFSSNQAINFCDLITYPDIADVTMYSYDNNGNKISSTDGNGISTYYSYDALGRLTYVYDQDNNIIERKTYVNNNTAINSTPTVNLSWAANGVQGILFTAVITGNNTCTFNGNSVYTWYFGDGNKRITNGLFPVDNIYSGGHGEQYTCTLLITSPNSAQFGVSTVVTLP